MTQHKAILIAGPTASGKSGLAMALADRLGGTIINSDSMQVYRELRVLTARPSPEDEARIPHAMYGFVAGVDAYSAGRFATDVTAAIAAVRAAGRVPIVVGGTGLYFKTLLEGLSPIPAIPLEVRAHWRTEAEQMGAENLHKVLGARDRVMAERLEPGDAQRIVRALEVLEATGRSLDEWQKVPGVPIVRMEETTHLVVSPDRDELYRNCDARLDAMMDQGATEEVRALVALGLDRDLPVMRALGVRPLMQLLERDLGPVNALAAVKAETRQYAKRQRTWLRGNMRSWKWLSTQEMQSIVAGDMAFIDH